MAKKKVSSKEKSELMKNLVWNPKHVFEVLKEEEKTQVESLSQKYLEFLSQAKTERETIEKALNLLEKEGFSEKGNKKGYVVYKNKLLFAWHQGKRGITEGLRIVVSHIDTPRLDLKLHPLFEDTDLAFLKTHYYGGIKKYHWVAQPLSLHGIVVKKDGSLIKVVLGEREDEPVFTICDLLPHLSRKVQSEKKLSEAILGEKLNVLFGGIPLEKLDEEKDLKERVKLNCLRILHQTYGIKEEDFVSAELYVVPAGRAREVGIDRAFIGGYGQDDRICAFTSLKAFLEVKNPEYINILLFMDREEIGSEGNTSAKSRVFEKFIYELIKKQGFSPTPDVFFEVMANTQAISADVTAGIDPNYIEVHDKLNDAKIGYGIAVNRYTGHGGKYMANEAHAEFLAQLLKNWDEDGVVYQVVSMGKVDEGGGGTVAKYFASYGMDVVDAGPPLLSMHSPFEVAHKADLFMCYRAYKSFFRH